MSRSTQNIYLYRHTCHPSFRAHPCVDKQLQEAIPSKSLPGAPDLSLLWLSPEIVMLGAVFVGFQLLEGCKDQHCVGGPHCTLELRISSKMGCST